MSSVDRVRVVHELRARVPHLSMSEAWELSRDEVVPVTYKGTVLFDEIVLEVEP